MLHGSLNGFFHKSMANSSGIDTEMTCGWKRSRSGQRGVRVGPYADVLVAIRSCGQALLWSCYIVLAHGIVWANHSICWSLLGELL
jgi:hypothetical protein